MSVSGKWVGARRDYITPPIVVAIMIAADQMRLGMLLLQQMLIQHLITLPWDLLKVLWQLVLDHRKKPLFVDLKLLSQVRCLVVHLLAHLALKSLGTYLGLPAAATTTAATALVAVVVVIVVLDAVILTAAKVTGVCIC